MKNIRSKTVLIVFLSLFIFSCTDDGIDDIVQETPNNISLKEFSLYPEGIIYSDITEKTYVGFFSKEK